MLSRGEPLKPLSRAKRSALFLQQARIAWIGGTLTRKERLMLDLLRSGLELGVDETTQLERRAVARAGLPSDPEPLERPAKGRPRPPVQS